MAVAALREVLRSVNVESLLRVPVDGIGDDAGERAHDLVGGDRERSRHRGIGGRPRATDAAARHCATAATAATAATVSPASPSRSSGLAPTPAGIGRTRLAAGPARLTAAP